MVQRKKTIEPPPVVVKEFSVQEIDIGIEKLRRRIADVQKLNPDKINHDDAEVDILEQQIRETIREIFGSNSPQFRKYQYLEIYHIPALEVYPPFEDERSRLYRSRKHFAAGIPQTVKTLEGLIAWLQETRKDLETIPIKKKYTAFEDMNFHPRIAAVASDLFRDGHYTNSVFEASKALVNYVKERSGQHDLDGATLMRTVFSKKDPILAFNDLKDQSDLDEQEGMMHLYEGAVLAIRNPRGHTFLDDSPERALEYIGLLSLLANRLQEAKRVK
jgi:uncharacterized protein (TIGR02391 family)